MDYTETRRRLRELVTPVKHGGAGLTFRGAAVRLHISPSTVTRILNGNAPITPIIVDAIERLHAEHFPRDNA